MRCLVTTFLEARSSCELRRSVFCDIPGQLLVLPPKTERTSFLKRYQFPLTVHIFSFELRRQKVFQKLVGTAPRNGMNKPFDKLIVFHFSNQFRDCFNTVFKWRSKVIILSNNGRVFDFLEDALIFFLDFKRNCAKSNCAR